MGRAIAASGTMSRMTPAEALRRATKIAEEILFPAAMAVDAGDRIPAEHLDALANAGLYGVAGPRAAGGFDANGAALASVIEIMSSGCLATTFVWLQHHSAVRALAASENAVLRDQWLSALCRGVRRAGIALGGAQPGPPLLRARAVPGGYLFDGAAPWVTGWDMIDVILTLARDDAGNVVAALLPARVSGSIGAAGLELVAVNASRTVELTFTDHFVPAELITGVTPHAQWLARDASGLRPNGSLSLGVAGRCISLLAQLDGQRNRLAAGARSLADELAACRAALDSCDEEAMPEARAAASAFAFQAAGVLVAAAGSRAILTGEHPQRLAREALFLLVFGSRPPIKAQLSASLIARGVGD
jgi:alkylation response protein AidB-like acyl-CoA dehydrogenase